MRTIEIVFTTGPDVCEEGNSRVVGILLRTLAVPCKLAVSNWPTPRRLVMS